MQITNSELTRFRKETSHDVSRLLESYLTDASENLRRALARTNDSALESAQRLPESLVTLLALARVRINAELHRRSR
jgi:hypothetical protein